MEEEGRPHFNIHRKRAAVDVYREAKRFRTEECKDSISPLAIAQVASGGAGRTQIFLWLKQDLSDEAIEERNRLGGRAPALKEDQEVLLVGFAVSRRLALSTVSLDGLQKFCENYLRTKPSLATLSRIMSRHGFSSQRARARAARLTTEEVVEDAIDAIEQIRSYNYPPHRIIGMDETGLWSNVASPKTYHFRNWSEILLLCILRPPSLLCGSPARFPSRSSPSMLIPISSRQSFLLGAMLSC
jgi:hypothetical protein